MLQAIVAGVVTFILTLVGIPAFIRFYHKAHISGQQMHEDVKQHQAKAGTPTMGGTVFLVASVLSSFVIALISRELSSAALMILFILVLYGIVGFLDDFLKIFRKINEGLKTRNMGLSIIRPIHSLEIYLVPMIYKAFETGEILSCALITKGIEYDCKKTSYEDLSFTWKDYGIILVGLVFLGITIWKKL